MIIYLISFNFTHSISFLASPRRIVREREVRSMTIITAEMPNPESFPLFKTPVFSLPLFPLLLPVLAPLKLATPPPKSRVL